MNKLVKKIIERRGLFVVILVFILVATLSKTVNELGVNYISDQKERKDGIMVGAEPFFIQQDQDIGVLLIHGFTSTPNDFRDLGIFLADRNITVYAPLLPGHGTHPKDLIDLNHQIWIDASQQAFNLLDTKKKFILGYSMGGTLALHLASQNDLDGVIAINSAIFLANRYIPFIPLVNLVETYTSSEPEKIVQFLNEERVVYDSYPLTSVIELQKLINALHLPQITEPLIIFQSEKDETVLPESANYIYNHVQSSNKEIIRIDNSTHDTIENQDEAFNRLYKFIQENS